MPLRDHFRPPVESRRHWRGLHGQWPAMLVLDLSRRLPPHCVAEPEVRLGTAVEIVATFGEEQGATPTRAADGGEGGVATAVWAPPRPTLAVRTPVPEQDEYEVRVFDASHPTLRLVAAVEIVSPANTDRPEHRRTLPLWLAEDLAVPLELEATYEKTCRVLRIA